jgi:virulence factor Mce-like protein
MNNRRHALIGLAVIVVIVVFTVYVVGGISGRVKNEFPVTARFTRVGQLLRVSGDVKMRGVIVGAIAKITHRTDGSGEVVLALKPHVRIPAGVSASIRGKTLFGEKFVELIDPPQPTDERLEPGTVIAEDRTIPAFELEQVLQHLVPVLDATEPGDLGGALHALAVGLGGNEEAAQRTIDNSLKILAALGANERTLDRLLSGVDRSSGTLSKTSADFLATLEDLDALNRSLIAHQGDLKAVLNDTPRWLDVVAQIVEARYQDLVDLSVKGADVLHLASQHRFALPSTVANLRAFTQNWVTNLSAPCRNAAGQTLGDSDFHPTLAGTTCWQVWIISAEKDKSPGGYDASTRPTPGTAAASAAYRAQLQSMLAMPFGTQPTQLQLFLYRAIVNADGLIPEALL